MSGILTPPLARPPLDSVGMERYHCDFVVHSTARSYPLRVATRILDEAALKLYNDETQEINNTARPTRPPS